MPSDADRRDRIMGMAFSLIAVLMGLGSLGFALYCLGFQHGVQAAEELSDAE